MTETNDGIHGWSGDDFYGSLFSMEILQILFVLPFVYLEFLKNLGNGEMKMLLQILISRKHISSTPKQYLVFFVSDL